MTASKPLHVVGFGGTLRPRSSTVRVLERVLSEVATQGATVELLQLEQLGLPFYEWGVEPTEGVHRLVRAFASADALVWASPLYHGTISGAFKNALDWLELLAQEVPPYLSDKPVGLIGVAGGVQSLQAISTMEHIVRSLRGWTIPMVVGINRSRDLFAEDGSIADPHARSQLAILGSELVKSAGLFRAARASVAQSGSK